MPGATSRRFSKLRPSTFTWSLSPALCCCSKVSSSRCVVKTFPSYSLERGGYACPAFQWDSQSAKAIPFRAAEPTAGALDRTDTRVKDRGVNFSNDIWNSIRVRGSVGGMAPRFGLVWQFRHLRKTDFKRRTNSLSIANSAGFPL